MSGFKSCSGRFLELFLGSPEFNSTAAVVNRQLVVASSEMGFLTILRYFKLFL